MAIEHSVVKQEERVDDPLIVTEFKIGLARSPQLDGKVFIGMTVLGFVRGGEEDDEYSGDMVMTVELAEALVPLLERAIARAKGQVS